MKKVFLLLSIFLFMQTLICNAQEVKFKKQVDKANAWNQEQFKIIKKNYSFASDCDTSKIKLTIIQTEMEAVGPEHYGGLGYSNKQKAYDAVAAKIVGVNGCGQKASYVYLPNTGWVVNSTTK